jgi:hypothetical protein
MSAVGFFYSAMGPRSGRGDLEGLFSANEKLSPLSPVELSMTQRLSTMSRSGPAHEFEGSKVFSANEKQNDNDEMMNRLNDVLIDTGKTDFEFTWESRLDSEISGNPANITPQAVLPTTAKRDNTDEEPGTGKGSVYTGAWPKEVQSAELAELYGKKAPATEVPRAHPFLSTHTTKYSKIVL